MGAVKAVGLFAISFGLGVVSAEAQVNDMPKTGDYAYGWAVVTQRSADFHEIVLPLVVYRSVTDLELRDLGVYNASDQPVPRVVYQHPIEEAESERLTEIPLLPLYRTTAGEQRAVVVEGRVEIAIDRPGETITVTVDEPDRVRSTPGDSLVAYILDTRELDEPIDGLVLHWPRGGETFIGRLMVAASDDLEHWSDIGAGSLAELRHAGHELERRSVDIMPRESDFFRLTWSRLPADWRLERIEGRHKKIAPVVSRERLVLQRQRVDADDNGHVFDTGGGLLVDQVTLALPPDNSMVTAAIYSRRSEQDAWQLRHRGLFYHLRRAGNALTNEAVELPAKRMRQWKVVVERGRQDTDFTLELGWRPDRLVFVAQGQPPYTLVAGRAEDEPARFPQERLFSDPAIRKLFDEDRLGLEVSVASLGDRVSLGGPDRLSLPTKPPWRLWSLWLGLGLGVLLIGAMAYSLARHHRTASS